MGKEKEINVFLTENNKLIKDLQQAETIEKARVVILQYVLFYEYKTLNTTEYAHPMERSVARKCINTLKNMFSKRSEQLMGFSAVEAIWKLSMNIDLNISKAFIKDLRRMFIGMKGETGIYSINTANEEKSLPNRTISRERSVILDNIAHESHNWINKYKSGLERDVIEKRKNYKNKILSIFNASEEDWNSWKWQCRNVIRDVSSASKVINLTDEELKSIKLAKKYKLPFGITPYYAMLMDEETNRINDHATRAQVIPPLEYSEYRATSKDASVEELDFMGENDTSPEDLITRRYPMVSIFKPYNTCSQICVYCQRNWEISDVLAEDAQASPAKIFKAIEWYKNHPEVTEILITGGDPAIMSDSVLKKILDKFCEIEHIKRIRIGTRIPVVMPMRVTENLVDLLSSYYVAGKREICVMTHFEHVYEITPEAMEAVQKLRSRGIPVYNQSVYTIENARRFEMVALRKALRSIGVEPYYTFNTKGKEETKKYRIPIARLIQEQAEEARLTPGLERTDEAVFNIPRLGKNYLKAGQDHEVIMILPTGERVYEFYPWDNSSQDISPYLHVDLPIDDFLDRIQNRGENIDNYQSIWYYL
jgi:lysine 2,3-aminomutase